MVDSVLKFPGGKHYLRKWLIGLFPERSSYTTFVDGCGGGGSVLLAHDPTDKAEVLNDLDGANTNFWRVLRDPLTFEAFRRRCEATPFSAVDWAEAAAKVVMFDGAEPAAPSEQVEYAWAFFVRSRQSLMGLGESFAPLSTSRLRRGMNEQASAWLGAVEGLGEVHRRLKTVVVTREPVQRLLGRLDKSGVHFYCLLPGTEVRTETEKFVNIENVRVGDRLAPGRTVQAVFRRKSEGRANRITVAGVCDPLWVTPEHRIPVVTKRTGKRQEIRSDNTMWDSRTLKPACEIEVGDYVLIPVGGKVSGGEIDWNWDNSNASDSCQQVSRRGRRQSGLRLNVGPELYRLMGYYAAEGHLQRNRGVPGSVVLSFGTARKQDAIRDSMYCYEVAFGARPYTRPGPSSDTVTQVVVNSRTVAAVFGKMIPGTATNKRLHDELMLLPKVAQREILNRWLRCDGCYENQSRNRVRLCGTTASRELAMQMYTIALRIGLRPSMKRRQGYWDVYFAKADTAALGFPVPGGRHDVSQRRIINGHILARCRANESVPYEGEVYDIDVDGDNLFCSPFVLTHNCDPPYHPETREAGLYRVEMSADQHAELLDAAVAVKHATVMISGYDCELYREKLQNWDVQTLRVDNKMGTTEVKQGRTEVVWRNYR